MLEGNELRHLREENGSKMRKVIRFAPEELTKATL